MGCLLRDPADLGGAASPSPGAAQDLHLHISSASFHIHRHLPWCQSPGPRPHVSEIRRVPYQVTVVPDDGFTLDVETVKDRHTETSGAKE